MFFRTPGSFVGSGEPLVRPKVTQQFDYEGEIALVIGKEGRRIAKERAHEHIAGYTLCNEGTAREWTRHSKFNVTQGKNFDGSGSLGPWMVTADEIDPAKPLHLTTTVNGELRQDDTTANLHLLVSRTARLHHDLHHAEARRHPRHRHAGRRRRALRSAALAQAGRRGGGVGAGDRHVNQPRGRRGIGPPWMTAERYFGNTSKKRISFLLSPAKLT